MATEHEAQITGSRLLALRSVFAEAENAAISANSFARELTEAYVELQKENVKQHALIVQMSEALKQTIPIGGDPFRIRSNAINAATQYLKGPKNG